MAFSRRTSNASREAALEASRLEAILSFSMRHAPHAVSLLEFPRSDGMMQQVSILALKGGCWRKAADD